MSAKFKNEVIINLLSKYELIWSLGYLSNLAGWELETYMPEAGAVDRGLALAKVKGQIQQLFLEKEFVALIKQAQKENNLNDYEKAVVRLLVRELDQFEKLPVEFVEYCQKLISEAQVAWRNAKDKNDFTIFAPYLENVVDMNIKQAEYLGYKEHSYDALLNLFEEGQTTKDVDSHFSSIKPILKKVLAYIQSSKKYKDIHPISREPYALNDMAKINNKVLDFFNVDLKRLRLDVSSHPFTSSFSTNDVRITTRYNSTDFGRSFTSTTHEYGHALYDLNCDPELNHTPIYGGTSLGIHESQSRFWENIVGRSESFIDKFHKIFQTLGSTYSKYSARDFYEYFNTVTPSLIRVEADEVTYHYHILIRFEIEKALLSKDLKVVDIVEAWNSKYKKYLGVDVPDNANGVLQDIHWSMGAMGYFPTYSIGTVLSSQWAHFLENELGNLDKNVNTTEGILKIQKWLKNNIHQFGSTYDFKSIIEKTTGEAFSTKYWEEYLENKYKDLY